jgi:hypothetical protein
MVLGFLPGKAFGIQPGFIPNPDTVWKPMLHCSPECERFVEMLPEGSSARPPLPGDGVSVA